MTLTAPDGFSTNAVCLEFLFHAGANLKYSLKWSIIIVMNSHINPELNLFVLDRLILIWLKLSLEILVAM